jgi:hypothetical protein
MSELAWAESTPVAQYLFSLRLGPLRVFPYRVTDTRDPRGQALRPRGQCASWNRVRAELTQAANGIRG